MISISWSPKENMSLPSIVQLFVFINFQTFFFFCKFNLGSYTVLYESRIQIVVGYSKLFISDSNVFSQTCQFSLEPFHHHLRGSLIESLFRVCSQKNLSNWWKTKSKDYTETIKLLCFVKPKLAWSVYFSERRRAVMLKMAISPTFGRVSKIVSWLVCPLVVGGGLCNRSGAFG